MISSRNILLALVAAALLILWSAIFIVDERQKALVMRFGEVQRIVEKPGLYFKWPYADEVVNIEDRVFMWSSDDKAVQVSDKQRYLVDIFTMVRISNAQAFRESVGADLDLARARIETRLDAALRQTYGRRTFDAALSKDRDVMMKEIRDQVRGEAAGLGIDIVDVRIRRTDLMKEVLDATYKRMQSERLAEAEDLRGKGRAINIQRIAETNRKKIELIAGATRQGEAIRGEGDAERNKVYAAAYEKDPEFFAFYRSMLAYTKSFANKDTTMVLNPQSEFFKYFGEMPTPAK
jgi:modulator of FtsH protease HflC